MKYKDFKTKIANMNVHELQEEAAKMFGAIAKSRLQIKAGKEKNLRSGYNQRRQLAMLKTKISEKI